MCFLILFCKQTPEQEENIYLDETLQKIYTLQDERNPTPLFAYLKNTNHEYRRAAALAFASIQHASAIEPLAALLTDEKEEVRSAAAYALGQTRHITGQSPLLKAFEKETSPAVKRDILEAVGKCGDRKGLDFITGLKFRAREKVLLLGQARALYRFALQNITSEKGTGKAVELLAPVLSGDVSFTAANYLSRTREIDLTPYAQQSIAAYRREKNLLIRMHLALAMGKAQEPKIIEFLKNILRSDADYRIKVNVIRAFRNFAYDQGKEAVLESLSGQDNNVSIVAAEYIQEKGVSTDAARYFEKAQHLTNWRSRALMLTAALKFSPDDKEAISAAIITAYKNSPDNYEKSFLLQAIAEYPPAYRFVEEQVFADSPPVIKNYGMAALVAMRRSKDFPADKPDLQADFARIFKKGIESDDISVIGQAAEILRDPVFNFKKFYPETAFLAKALTKLRLPRDSEAHRQLQEAVAFFAEKKSAAQASQPGADAAKAADLSSAPQNPINWPAVTAVKSRQQIKIKTTKGDIVIELFVNDSPGSAANFLRLIQAGFYKNDTFHRVVPNFVIQAGCPRGDGWGGPDFTIRSEFSPLYYEEGSVGMASSGKDTEGSQWFITHSPTPHLDGRYTIFGKVVSGMEAVHRIEIGDMITGFEIVR